MHPKVFQLMIEGQEENMVSGAFSFEQQEEKYNLFRGWKSHKVYLSHAC